MDATPPVHYPPPPIVRKVQRRYVKVGPGLRCWLVIVNGKPLNRMYCEILGEPSEEKVL